MFGNFIKIAQCASDQESASNEIIFPAFQDNFISVKAIKSSEELSQFLRELDGLNVKLDALVARLYRSEEKDTLLQKYEEALRDLKQKKVHLKYLTNYFDQTKAMLEAIKCRLEEDQKTVDVLQNRKAIIKGKIKRLKLKNTKTRHRLRTADAPLPNFEFGTFGSMAFGNSVFLNRSSLSNEQEDVYFED